VKSQLKKISKVILLATVISVIILPFSVYSFSISNYSQRSGPFLVDHNYRKVVLIEPTPLRGCNGLIFGKDDALYVCQSSPNTISRIDLHGRRGPRVETFVGPNNGVITPDDITVDDKGNLYATSAIGGEVYKIDSKGMKEVIARGLSGPNGISFDEETGRLFVSECFWGNRIWELDPQGVDPPRLVNDTLSTPEGFDIRDGKLVIPDLHTMQIIEMDMDTGVITPLVTSGLITPIALKIGPDGYIYTPELATGWIKKISPDGSSIEDLTQLLPGADNLAFGPDGYLYVSSYHDSTIWKVDPDSGDYTTLFPMGINSAASIVVKGDELYISDSIMIRRIDKEGNLHKTYANGWLSASGYPLPVTMTNGIGDYFITGDFIDGIVVAVNPNVPDDWMPLAYPVASPAGMEVDFENLMLYVAEYGLGQVIEVSLIDGSRRVVTDSLSGPVDVLIKDGDLYVAEALAGRITKVDIASGEKEIFLNGYVGKPKGIAWDRKGNLLILDTAKKELLKVNMKNLDISIVACDLPTDHTTYYPFPLIWDTPAPIAVNDNGDIFLVGGDGSVIKLKYRGHCWCW
jgi:sugar lactone lactonase YvrE